MLSIAAALYLSGSIWAVNGAVAQTPVRFSIDWVFQGAHAPFAVAIQKNYYKREGLDVTMDRGTGSGETVGRVATGTYDIGYGDTNLLIKFNHDHPDTAVTAVLMVYNSTPAGIVTLTKTGVREPKDLAGRNIASPIGDAARLLFPAFAQKVGIDSNSIEWTSSLPNLRDTLLFQGKVDAVASYVPTTIMALEALRATKDESSYSTTHATCRVCSAPGFWSGRRCSAKSLLSFAPSSRGPLPVCTMRSWTRKPLFECSRPMTGSST